MILWIIAFLVMVALIAAAIYLIIDLALLPGRIADHRGHPQVDGVRIAGILGIFTGILWVLALIWAFVPYPSHVEVNPNDKSDEQRPHEATTVTEGST